MDQLRGGADGDYLDGGTGDDYLHSATNATPPRRSS